MKDQDLADLIVSANSRPIAIWIVATIILCSLILHCPQNSYEWIIFASSVFYQGIMLPVLLVAGKREARRNAVYHLVEIRKQFALMREEHKLLLQISKGR